MKLHFTHVEGLPALAWIAWIDFKTSVVSAFGGIGVCYRGNWLFEGAWAGDFESGNFTDVASSFGSGLRALPDHVLISAPSSTLDCIYHRGLHDGNLLVSNSLAAIVSVLKDAPRFDGTNYLRIFESTRFGLTDYVADIPFEHNRVSRFYFDCLACRPSSTPKLVRRPRGSDFADFNAYERYLTTELSKLQDNANAPSRTKKYPLRPCVSSGYDSPAVASLAKSIGVKRALTFRNAREQFDNANDSGEGISSILGFDVGVYDRLDYLTHEASYEVAALSTGVGGEDIVFASFGNDLAQSCLLTGFLGDKVWGPSDQNLGLDISRVDNGGGSLGELRLDMDFFHVPVPYIGIFSQRSISRISHSAEMKPWSVGGDYDRPIARRLVESAGVPRTMFGIEKKAVTQAIGLESVFNFDLLSDDAQSSYMNFLTCHGFQLDSPKAHKPKSLQALHYVTERLVWRKSSMPLWAKTLVNKTEKYATLLEPAVSGPSRFLWHWAFTERCRRYKVLQDLRV